MNQSIKNFILIICLALPGICKAQNLGYISIVNGTYYYATIVSTAKNGRQLINKVVFNTVPQLDSTTLDKSTLNNFICSIYNSAVYVESTGRARGIREYFRNRSGQRINRIERRSVKGRALINNRFLKGAEFFLGDSSIVIIYYGKFKGSFTKMTPTTKYDFLNRINDQVDVNQKCYSKDYYYIYRTTDKVYKYGSRNFK